MKFRPGSIFIANKTFYALEKLESYPTIDLDDNRCITVFVEPDDIFLVLDCSSESLNFAKERFIRFFIPEKNTFFYLSTAQARRHFEKQNTFKKIGDSK